MQIRRIFAAGVVISATIGLLPSGAGATECVEDTGVGVVDDKVVGDTCWGCGYLEVRGKVIYNFPCGP